MGDPNQQAFIVRKICLDAFAINEFQKPKQFKGIGKVILFFFFEEAKLTPLNWQGSTIISSVNPHVFYFDYI